MSVQMPDINLVLLLPEIVVAVAAMGLLLADAWWGKEGRNLVGSLALVTVAVAAGLTLMGLNGKSATTFGGLFVSDTFSAFMKVLMYFATGFAILISWEYQKKRDLNGGEYYVLTLLSMLGAMIMASSGNFLTLYLGLELMSLSIYVLAAYRRDDLASNEAGLKYFILGSLGSGFLLYGISMLYGATGSTDFGHVRAALTGMEHANLVVSLGMVLVVAGLSFKLAAVPFHMWAPDVYEGAPTSVVAFMAVLPKMGAFAALYRVLLEALLPIQGMWSPVIQLLAALSVALGAVAAIAQTNIKRMLAYSSIAHVGYALVGVAAGNALGHQAVIIYLTVYLFMNLGTFALVLAMNSDESSGEEIDDYKGLGHRRPVLAFLMMVMMFSMAGIPPLAGFVGKLYVFMAAIEAGLTPLAVWAILFSAVAAYYYIRIVKIMYFDEPTAQFAMPMTGLTRVVVAVSTAVILVWGVFPGSLLAMAKSSVQQFM